MTDKPKKKPRRTLAQIKADIEVRSAREAKVIEVRSSRDELCAAIGSKEWAIAADWAKALTLQLEALATAQPAPTASQQLALDEGAP